MGEYFHLVAPRAQHKLSIDDRISGSSPGVDFWDGTYSRRLVNLLAIPILPQRQAVKTTDAHETTIDAIDNIRSVARPGKRKTDDQMPGDATISKRVKTNEKQSMTSEEDDSATATATVHRKTTTSFSDFPREIHRLIFAQIEYLVDTVNLGATSQYYWTLARECLDEYAVSLFGQWAGEKIVCVGNDVKQDDYPPGMFTAEERDKFRSWTAPADEDYESDEEQGDRPFTLYHFGHSSFYNSQPQPRDPFFQLLEVLTQGFSVQCTLPRIVQTYLREREWERLLDKYFPRDQQWILRNLTTKQFVRAEAIALEPEFIKGPFIRGLGFAEVVMSRICWSSSDCIGMLADPIDITRGVWAGHCFDITTRAKHEDETKGGQGWEDASDEVAAELAKIWEGEIGSYFLKEVRESVR